MLNDNPANKVFIHDVPANELTPELYPTEYAARLLWNAALLPDPTGKIAKITIDSDDPEVVTNVTKAVEGILNQEIDLPDFKMYDDQLAAKRREAVKFAIMEDSERTNRDIPDPEDMDEWALIINNPMDDEEEYPDLDLGEPVEFTEEEQILFEEFQDWCNNIFEHDFKKDRDEDE